MKHTKVSSFISIIFHPKLILTEMNQLFNLIIDSLILNEMGLEYILQLLQNNAQIHFILLIFTHKQLLSYPFHHHAQHLYSFLHNFPVLLLVPQQISKRLQTLILFHEPHNNIILNLVLSQLSQQRAYQPQLPVYGLVWVLAESGDDGFVEAFS